MTGCVTATARDRGRVVPARLTATTAPPWTRAPADARALTDGEPATAQYDARTHTGQ